MRALRLWTLIAALTCGSVQAWAQTSPAAMAAPAYSADALYNLGNAYARAGKPGLAVLSYERAALLAPGDPDLNANLTVIRNAAHVSLRPQSRVVRLVRAMSPAAAAWIGVLGLILVGSGLIANRIASRRFRWMARGAIAIGVVQLGLTTSSALSMWPRLHEAVILVDQTAAHVAPAPMADTGFVLREAESVRMLAAHEDFILIRTSDGQSGWVARANLGAVVPTEVIER